MRKFTSTLVLLLFLLKINAQVCSPISFLNQADIDLFLVNNPTCTEIDGNVYIFGSGITNLNGLKNIKKIKGVLTISFTSLSNLNNLSALQSTGGLQILSNEKLVDIAGLTSLSNIDGDLQIKDNILIATIALPAITQVKSFVVEKNSALNTIAFNNLVNVRGSFSLTNVDLLQAMALPKLSVIDGEVELLNLKKLENFDLLSLDSIKGTLYVYATSVKTIDLPQLEYLKGEMTLSNLESCTTINLPSLKAYQGNLSVSLPSLTDFNMLSMESVSGNIDLSKNQKLQLLRLPSLTKVGGAATMSYNPELTDIEIGKLKSLKSNLNIESNVKLSNVNLMELDSIKGRTEINRNGNMKMLSLNSLKYTVNLKCELNVGKFSINLASLNSIKEFCQFSQNKELSVLDLSSLQQTNFLTINDNTGLQSVYAPNLQTANTVQIFNNSDLKDINISVDSLIYTLAVTKNPLLESISAKKLRVVGFNFNITENPLLVNVDFGSLSKVNNEATINLKKEGSFDFSKLQIVKSLLDFNCINKYEFPSIERIGRLSIRSSATITDISFPKLKTSNSIEVSFNKRLKVFLVPALDTVSLLYFNQNDSLREINAILTKAVNIQINSNNLLNKIILDNLTKSSIAVSANNSLATLSLSSLESAIGITVDRNPKLNSFVVNKIKNISGSFRCTTNPLLTDISVPNLISVLNDLAIQYNSSLTVFNVNSLKSIGNFYCENNALFTNLKFPELLIVDFISIKGNALLNTVEVDKIKSSSLNIEDNALLTNVSFKNLIELDILQLRNNDSIKNFNLDMLNVVYSDIYIALNDILQSVSLSKLVKCEGEIYIGGQSITKLSLSSFEEVSKRLFIAAVSVDSLIMLKLKKVGTELRIANLVKSTNIYFPSLNSVGGPFVITDCKKLMSLSGISRLRANNFTLANWYISITGCKQLSFCNVPFLCEASISFPAKIYFSSNAIGCNDESELSCTNNFISGKIFYDKNKNGIQDNNEFAMPNARVVDKESNTIYFCDESGLFSFAGVENQKYNLVPQLPSNMTISTASQSYEFVFKSGEGIYHTFNFGIHFTSEFEKVELEVSNDLMRCNTETSITVTYQNTGSKTIDGYLEVMLDDKITYLNASVSPLEIQGNIIEWKIDDLEPFTLKEIVINVKAPSEVFTGKIVAVEAVAYADAEHKIELSASSIEKVVRCSYDPNDKAVSPLAERSDNPTPFMTPFQYTIRFQNTGNDVAYNIEIKDTLDANLDLNTFKIIKSSFPVNTALVDNKVSFKFNDINLPSEKQNEPASHGYVSYAISPLSNLSPSTQIFNKAGIYFDSNPPIITNEVVNTLNETSTDEVVPSYRCYLQPSIGSQEICIVYRNPSIRPIKTELYDSQGRLLKYINTTCFSIVEFKSGMYFLKIYGDRQAETLNFIKI